METNKKLFEETEADGWFERNLEAIERLENEPSIAMLSDWLEPFKEDISCVLEIGCGSGHNLNRLSSSLCAEGVGIDPSPKAVQYLRAHFPQLDAHVSFGDSIPLSKEYDLVHLGFFLYLVDRKYYLRCISEADRMTKFGGFLSILDFETPYPYSNQYAHLDGVFTHKQNNSEVFVASGLYSVVNKFQFSLKDYFFNKDINERVSLTLLYKETELFKAKNKNP